MSGALKEEATGRWTAGGFLIAPRSFSCLALPPSSCKPSFPKIRLDKTTLYAGLETPPDANPAAD